MIYKRRHIGPLDGHQLVIEYDTIYVQHLHVKKQAYPYSCCVLAKSKKFWIYWEKDRLFSDSYSYVLFI